MGLVLATGAGCHHLRQRGLKGFLPTSRLWILLSLSLAGAEKQTGTLSWTNLLSRDRKVKRDSLGSSAWISSASSDLFFVLCDI